MPPVTQGSRTPLVIWTVVSSFVFVIAIVVAIYFYVDASDARETLETQQRRFRDVVAEAELTSPEITALSEAKQNDPNLNPSMTAMQVALAQRDALAEKIAGAAVADDANSAARATRDANAVIARAAERLKLDEKKLPADNLVAAVQTLARAWPVDARAR